MGNMLNNSGDTKVKKPIYKRWWFWVIIAWLLLGFITLIASCSLLAKSIDNIDPNQFTFPSVTEAPTDKPTEAPTEAPTEKPTEAPTEAVLTQLAGYVNKPLVDFMKKVDELGYTATYYNQGVDYTEILGFYTEEDCESFLIGSIDENPAKKTVVVDLLLKTTAENEEAESVLSDKLETGSAWVAVENYGEDLYGDFELHYFFGKIEEYAEDADTWFLKAECTVYGTEMICEAKVTGTSNNPEVIYFIVY